MDPKPLITSRAIDALLVSPEVFIQVAQEILKLAKSGDLSEAPFLFGQTAETIRPAGTIYIIPESKRRAAFPLIWDTERYKYQYPKLFQALTGPEWSAAFNATEDPNGTIHLQDGKISEVGQTILDLPDLIDEYLDQRFPERGLLLLYRPLFSSVDRVRACHIEDKATYDQAITKFLRELYGFYPSNNVNPTEGIFAATEGVAAGYGVGVPEVRTAAISGWRYVSAASVKEAKKATRFYTSFKNARQFGDPEWPIFRFKIEDSEPNWKTIKEMHSEAEDSITIKSASIDPWLVSLEKFEQLKMSHRLKKALSPEYHEDIPFGEAFNKNVIEDGDTCDYCGAPAEGCIIVGDSNEKMCKDCYQDLTQPPSEDEYTEWLRGTNAGSMSESFDEGIHSDPSEDF